MYLAFSKVAAAVFPMAPNPTPTARPSAKKYNFNIQKKLFGHLWSCPKNNHHPFQLKIVS